MKAKKRRPPCEKEWKRIVRHQPFVGSTVFLISAIPHSALLDHIDKGLTMHAARKEMEDKAKLEDLKVEVGRHRKEEQAAKRILQERIDAEEAISAAISRMEEGWKSEVEALKADIKENSSHLDEQLKKLDTDIQVAKRDLQGLGRVVSLAFRSNLKDSPGHNPDLGLRSAPRLAKKKCGKSCQVLQRLLLRPLRPTYIQVRACQPHLLERILIGVH